MARDGKRHRSSSPDRDGGGSGGGGGRNEQHSKHRKYSYHHSRDSDRDRDRDRGYRDRDRERERSRSPDRRGRSSRSWHSSRSPSREDDLGGGRQARGDRGGKWKQRSPSRSPSPSNKWEKQLNGELTKEREQLDKQSMKALAAIQDGSKKAKRVIVKQRGKFDWENTEDTSQDMIPICHGQLLFGRGFYAGMDRREQKKQSAKVDRDAKGQIEAKALKPSYDPFDDMPVDRHWSEKEVHEMTPRDWRIFREDYNISYKGSRFPNPARNWEESGISPELLRAVQEAGYKNPTPIQMASIPLGLQQRDVIGIAGTGSGKTAAFVIPMLTYVSKLPKMTLERAIDGPYALVMAPTTELAQQIHEETVKMAKFMDIKVLSLVAGENIGDQSSRLLQGCEIVIATPGRLLHCLEHGYAVLHQCNYVVLDEGDRMIALGFEEQVIDALEAMPSSNMKPESEDVELEDRIYRTTYMFSATMPPAVERLAKKYLRNPVVVTIEELSKRISQRVLMVDEEEKPKRLRRLLDELGEMSTIVFVNTKKQADKVSKQLNDLGIKVATIHGGKTQQKRQTNFQDFRSKRRSCLIATDVVGRGIDVPDVGHVINYDMPSTVEMYIHRIGRTGRAGKSGAATTFLTLQDVEVFYDLKQLLVRTKNPVPPELARHEAAKVKVLKSVPGTAAATSS